MTHRMVQVGPPQSRDDDVRSLQDGEGHGGINHGHSGDMPTACFLEEFPEVRQRFSRAGDDCGTMPYESYSGLVPLDRQQGRGK